MPINSLSKALEFYDMGFVPGADVEDVDGFVDDCNQKLYIIEELYKNPREYFERNYNISSDISLLDEETSLESYKILNENYGLNPPYPVLVSEKDFKEISYKLGISNPFLKFLQKYSFLLKVGGTAVKIGNNDSSVVCPILNKKNWKKEPKYAAHELLHTVRYGIEGKPKLHPIDPVWQFKYAYSTFEEEFLAYNINFENLDPFIFGFGIGLIGFIPNTIIMTILELSNNPSLIYEPLNLISEVTRLPRRIWLLSSLFPYFIGLNVKRFKKNAEKEGLNPSYILSKASVIELGTKNIKEKIKTKDGLKWELLRAKFDI